MGRPASITKVTISEVKEAFKGKITIWGGIPSLALLEESIPDEKFERLMRNLFREIAPGDQFILGINNTTPTDVKFERFPRITEMVWD